MRPGVAARGPFPLRCGGRWSLTSADRQAERTAPPGGRTQAVVHALLHWNATDCEQTGAGEGVTQVGPKVATSHFCPSCARLQGTLGRTPVCDEGRNF